MVIRRVTVTPDYYAKGAPFLKKRGSRALCARPISPGVELEVARISHRRAYPTLCLQTRGPPLRRRVNQPDVAARHKRSTVTRVKLAVSSHVGCRARACWEQRLQDLRWKSAPRYSHKGRGGRVLQVRHNPGYRLEEQEGRTSVRLYRIRRPSVRSYSRWERGGWRSR